MIVWAIAEVSKSIYDIAPSSLKSLYSKSASDFVDHEASVLISDQEKIQNLEAVIATLTEEIDFFGFLKTKKGQFILIKTEKNTITTEQKTET